MQKRFPQCLLLVAIFVSGLFAQQPDADAAKLKKERRAKLIERITADVEQLKLPENRAIIRARIGALVWKTDAEQARKLFRSAIADLAAAQQEAEAARGKSHLYYDLLNSQNTRPQLLNTIATVDAAYALESLYSTRPALVARAMAGDTLKTKIDLGQTDRHIAQNELNLEQRISRLLADQTPEKAVEILKENVKKRLSNETYETLKKLYATDPRSAAELADDVVSRLNSAAFYSENQADHALMQVSTSIITDHLRERSPNEKYLAFAESGVRQLAVKLIETYLNHGSQIGWVPFDQLEPFAKRYAPGSVEPLRTTAQSGRNGFSRHNGITTNAEYNKLMGTNPTADQMIQAAGSFTPDLQRQLYQSAANKFSETGRYQNAVALLQDKFEGDALENAVNSLNWYYAQHLVQKGEFDAAEAMMLEFNDSNRISALTSLAQNMYSKNPGENRSRAAALLQRVRGLMPDRPETSNDTNQMFALIGAMVAIEPSDAFTNLEGMVDQLNRLVQAFAIVQTYSGILLRHGEYTFGMGGNFGFHFDMNIFRSLAQVDFDRTNAIVDRFERPELRVSLRMYLAEGL